MSYSRNRREGGGIKAESNMEHQPYPRPSYHRRGGYHQNNDAPPYIAEQEAGGSGGPPPRRGGGYPPRGWGGGGRRPIDNDHSDRAYFTYGNQQQNDAYEQQDNHRYKTATVRGGASSYVPQHIPRGANEHYHLHGGTPPNTSPSIHPSTPTTTYPTAVGMNSPGAPPYPPPQPQYSGQRIVKVETVNNVVHTYRSNVPYRRWNTESPPAPVGEGGSLGGRTPSNGSSPNLGPQMDPYHSNSGNHHSNNNSGPNVCRHFLNGNCNRGAVCRFVHLEKHHVVVRTSRTPNNVFHAPAPLSPGGFTDESGAVAEFPHLDDLTLPPATGGSFTSQTSAASKCHDPYHVEGTVQPFMPPSPQRKHDPYGQREHILNGSLHDTDDESGTTMDGEQRTTEYAVGDDTQHQDDDEDEVQEEREDERVTVGTASPCSQSYQRASTDMFVEDPVSDSRQE